MGSPVLVPQVPDLDGLLSHMFSDLGEHPEKAEGAGQLLFEMCKGVRNMFHSCAAKVRESIMGSVGFELFSVRGNPSMYAYCNF